MVSSLIKTLEDWDAEFRKQHNVVLDLTEDESDAIKWEQSIFDEHDEKVTQLSLHLQVLGLEGKEAEPAPMSHTDTSQHLGIRLRYISDVMGTVHEFVDGLVPGRGFDDCLLQVLEKWIDKLTSELSDATCDILYTKDND